MSIGLQRSLEHNGFENLPKVLQYFSLLSAENICPLTMKNGEGDVRIRVTDPFGEEVLLIGRSIRKNPWYQGVTMISDMPDPLGLKDFGGKVSSIHIEVNNMGQLVDRHGNIASETEYASGSTPANIQVMYDVILAGSKVKGTTIDAGEGVRLVSDGESYCIDKYKLPSLRKKRWYE